MWDKHGEHQYVGGPASLPTNKVYSEYSGFCCTLKMERLTPRGHRALFGWHRASGINTEETSSKESVLRREGPKPG